MPSNKFKDIAKALSVLCGITSLISPINYSIPKRFMQVALIGLFITLLCMADYSNSTDSKILTLTGALVLGTFSKTEDSITLKDQTSFINGLSNQFRNKPYNPIIGIPYMLGSQILLIYLIFILLD